MELSAQPDLADGPSIQTANEMTVLRGPLAELPLAPPADECALFSGAETYAVQALLGALAMGTLWYKRHVERPRRTLRVWLLDVSKQALGAGLAHVLNLGAALQLPPVTDECVWYFLNFMSDCTLGMAVSLAFLRLLQELAFALNWSSIQQSGEYGNPPSYRTWALQLVAWLAIIVVSKAIVLSVLVAGATPLGTFGGLLFAPLQGYPLAELLLVMVVCPTFLNIVQFWVQDSFLKRDVSILPPAYARFRHSFEDSLQTKLLVNE